MSDFRDCAACGLPTETMGDACYLPAFTHRGIERQKIERVRCVSGHIYDISTFVPGLVGGDGVPLSTWFYGKETPGE